MKTKTAARPERPSEMRTYTPEIMVEQMQEDADYVVNSAKRGMDEFAVKFAADPTYALSWSRQTFEQAATLKITNEVKRYLTLEGKNAMERVNILSKEMMGKTVRKARFPEHSTSPTSNLMSLCENSARAEWLEKIERRMERIGTEYKHYL